ncbi:MAG: MgtC/SapB family protein [Anaerolineaceae bacterium]
MIPTEEIILRLFVSVLLGGLVGYERERDNQPAGLRTHMILALGSCLAMILSVNSGVEHGSDPTRMAAQVISGIGFLGAGAILRFGFNVKGLTTATTLWTIAIMGLAVGYGYYLVSVVTTAFMLVILTLVHLFENRFIRTNVVRIFRIDAQGEPGVIRTIRKTIGQVSDKLVNFSVQKSNKNNRIRVEIVAQINRGENMENLVELLSNIEGVRSIRIE